PRGGPARRGGGGGGDPPRGKRVEGRPTGPHPSGGPRDQPAPEGPGRGGPQRGGGGGGGEQPQGGAGEGPPGPRGCVDGGRGGGDPAEVMRSKGSLTGRYLSGALEIELPAERRRGDGRKVRVVGARENNLKEVTVEVPLGLFVCVTGVSGAGKSTLVNQILYPAAAKALHDSDRPVGAHTKVEGLQEIDKVIDIDQSPIGR